MPLSRHAVMRSYLLIFGGVFLFSSVLNLVQLWHQRTDIWWTPPNLAVPLKESGDRVRIYVRGEPLEEVVTGARLQLGGSPGGALLTPGDVTLRFNNYDRVRANRLIVAASYGVGAGASLVALIFGILGLSPRRERQGQLAE